jgi:hypothetical protein
MPKIVAVLAFTVVALLAPDAPGSQLTTGARLYYESGGQEGPPWTIVSVNDTTLGGMTACRAIVLQMDAARPAERRNWCTRGDTLFAWDTSAKAHRPLRPIGEGMRMEVPIARGGVVRYETRSFLDQTVSGTPVKVIQTVVITRDSTGRPRRRLREFYAPGLATATSGVFEEPDTAQAEGWKIQSSFKLARIVR